ncbi:hypothetical protein [Microcoleus sp. bin38.metabat.b11b12b14.051]|nr:hypothetical protein [Microcoleus sp. bin38.metabat.b11b12b14.051]
MTQASNLGTGILPVPQKNLFLWNGHLARSVPQKNLFLWNGHLARS